MGDFAKFCLFVMLALMVLMTCNQLLELNKISDELERLCLAKEITCPTRTPTPDPTQ